MSDNKNAQEKGLQLFIKETLTQINNGIIDAQNALNDTEALICPPMYQDSRSHICRVDINNAERYIHDIKFNVGLNVTEISADKVGLGVALMSLGAGVSNKKEYNDSAVHHIEFTIPVSYPLTSKDNKANN